MHEFLNEDTRQQLLAKSKRADNYVPSNQMFGKNRYERRLKSRIISSVSEYNQMDMNKLFRDGILDVVVKVHGETDDYYVTISFGMFLDEVHNQLKRLNTDVFDLKIITRALISSFNREETYIHCTCPDWLYRMSYWSKVNKISSRPDEEQNDNGYEIVNPNDTKGPGCKHTLLVLSNSSWIIKVASVINNYTKYMKEHNERLYADIIYPALFEKEFEEPVQLDIENNPDLSTDTDTLDTANKWNRTRTQFQKGNNQGIRFTSPNNKQIDFDNLMSDNT